jgi:membrane protease YdiL (CAAX protease family)
LNSISGTGRVIVGVALAFTLWAFTFLTGYLGSFWYRVTISVISLAVYATLAEREMFSEAIRDLRVEDISKGFVAGALLYALFYIGYSILRSFLVVGASDVYLFRLESPTIIIASSLILTSFCEEYFWRAYVQRSLTVSHGSSIGVLATTMAYALIHAPTMNVPLIAAALIAGLFWGILYQRTRSLWLVIASHLVWTELIFVFLPLG